MDDAKIFLTDDPVCRFCNSTEGQVKAGVNPATGNQRYKCTTCQRRYTATIRPRGYSDTVRGKALILHDNGVGIREIGRRLGVNPQSVTNWLRRRNDTTDVPVAPVAPLATVPAGSRSTRIQTPDKRRVTITDVAKHAGVSNSTVSNFLTNKGSMSTDTRKRVQEAIELLQFTPSALVHAIRNRKTQIIGVVMFGLDTLDVSVAQSLTPPLLAGINAAANEAEYNVLLYRRPPERPRTQPGLPYLDGHIDGLVWVAPEWKEPNLERVARAGLPTVAILSRHLPPGVGYVNSDNFQAMRDTVGHLYALGHRRIAYAGPAHDSNFRDRREGYRAALQQVGLRFDPDLEVVQADPQWQAGPYGRALDIWEALKSPPTAIVLPDDGIADFFIVALNERGKRVPEDISVTGVNDLPDAQRIGGGLTTARQPLRDMGRMAVERLLALMSGAPAEECQVTVPTELIVRQTTGPPPSR